VAEGQADREVLFRLKVVTDDGNAQEFTALIEQFSAAQNAAHQSAAEAAEAGAQLQLEAYAAAYQQAGEQAKQFATGVSQQAAASQAVAAATGKQSQATRDAVKAERELENEALRVKRSILTPQQKYNEELADLYKLYDAGQLGVEEYGLAAEKAHAKATAAIQKEAAAAERAMKAEERERDKQTRAIDAQQRRVDQATEQARSQGMAMKASISEIGEGALRAGRGLSMLGLVGEESTKKIVDGLLKIQAGYDILKGGFEVWRKSAAALDAYRKMVQSTAAAEEALAAAQTMRAAAGVRANAAGVSGGVAGKLAGGASIGGGTLAMGAGMVAAAGGLAYMAYRERQNPADAYGFDEQTGLPKEGAFGPSTTLGWLMSTGGRYGTDASGVELRERAIAAQKRTKAMDAAREQQADRLEITRAGMAGQERIDVAAGESQYRQQADARRQAEEERVRRQRYESTADYRASQEALYRNRPGERATEEDRARYAMDVRRSSEDYQTTSQTIDATANRDQAVGAYDQARAAADAANRRIAEAERRSRELSAGMIGGERVSGAEMSTRGAEERARIEGEIAAAQRESVAAQNRLLEETQNRLRTEQEISRVRIQAAERGVQFTKDEIALREQLIEREQGRVRSAQERLAGMSEAEFAEFRRQVEEIRRQQAAGGELTSDQFKFAQGLRDYSEFDDITRRAAETTGERRRQQLGLAETEAENAARLRGEKKDLEQKLEVQLRDERELRLTVERDDSGLARRLAEEAATIMQERDRTLMDQFRREYQAEMAKLRADIDARNRAAGQRRQSQ
jgi:hypothetical protein